MFKTLIAFLFDMHTMNMYIKESLMTICVSGWCLETSENKLRLNQHVHFIRFYIKAESMSKVWVDWLLHNWLENSNYPSSSYLSVTFTRSCQFINFRCKNNFQSCTFASLICMMKEFIKFGHCYVSTCRVIYCSTFNCCLCLNIWTRFFKCEKYKCTFLASSLACLHV